MAPQDSQPKPRLLVGSQASDRAIATAVKAGLEEIAEVTLWCRGTFDPDGGAADGMLDASRIFDFAAFVLTPDDLAPKRAAKRPDPNDHVILPLGMFLGALGRQRTFIICSTDALVALPSDLRGVVAATYPPPRTQGAPPAVACACAIIKEQVLRLLPSAAGKSATRSASARPNQVARRRRRGTLGTAYLAGPRRVLKIADISMSGALLESYGEIPEGQLLDLDLALEDGSRVRVSARVTRNQHPQWGRTGGVGVAFLHFEGDSRDHLARYIDAAAEAGSESERELAATDVPAR
jgi:hypothetical protein